MAPGGGATCTWLGKEQFETKTIVFHEVFAGQKFDLQVFV